MATGTQPKTVCPAALTLGMFLARAKHLDFSIMGSQFSIPKKEFSSGSFGWYTQEKQRGCTICEVAGVVIQIQVTATIVGSKDAPRS